MNALAKATAAKIMIFDSLELATTNQTKTLLIDDFILAQQVSDNGVDQSATNSLVKLHTGTQLNQATRNVSVLATGGIYEFETVIIDDSFLKINNSGGLNGSSFIEYRFAPINFSALSHGILLSAIDVDFDMLIKFSINENRANFGFQTYRGGHIFQPYSTFSGDKNQFNRVNHLRIDFKVEQRHSARSKITRLDDYRKVPPPAILNLLGLGAMELNTFAYTKHG